MDCASRLDWIKFGIYGFLLSIIGSAVCACATRMDPITLGDVYNMMTLLLFGMGIILLIAGMIGALFVKNSG